MKYSTFAAVLLSAVFMVSCGDSSDPTPPPVPALTLSGETLTFGSDVTTQTFTITCNTTWSASSDAPWCELSTTGGDGNGTVTVTIATTSLSQRTATITLKTTSGTPEQTKTITVTQAGSYPAGGLADRITIEGAGSSAKLVITRNPTDAGLFFKFGSVVGIFSGNGANQTLPASVGDAFDSGDVAFNPTATAAYNVWDDVPCTSAGEIEHTLTNVQAGKGDPCRLVGYTAQQIKDATVVPDNGTWRLPTNADNQAFTGQTDYIETSVHWWSAGQSGNISSGVAGAEFPSRGNGGAGKFLPAAGSRSNTNGTTSYIGMIGNYWSGSTAGTYCNGLAFEVNGVYPQGQAPYASGYPVRCVRQ